MQTFEGKSVFGGIAMGKIRVYQKDEKQVEHQEIRERHLRRIIRETNVSELDMI